jgi:hypothetical protein
MTCFFRTWLMESEREMRTVDSVDGITVRMNPAESRAP